MTYLRMNHFLKLRASVQAPAAPVEAPAPAPVPVPVEAPRIVRVSKVKRRHVALAACAILASGCGREAPTAHNGQPSQVATSHDPIPHSFARDPSVPDASAVFAAQDAAVKAQAVAVPQPAATPEKKMTKEEESKAMPMAGQANNHSAPVPAKTGGR